jgi:RNA polymerase sigma-70 factor (ECF subfamily)
MATPDYWRLYSECVGSPSKQHSCRELFSNIAARLRSIAFRIAYTYRCENECEDIVQEIHVKFVSDPTLAAALPREPHRALAYLMTVAANVARDFCRHAGAECRDHTRTIPLDDTPLAATSREFQVDQEILLREIEDCLPPDNRDRVVFNLYFRQGLTAQEIAAIPAIGLRPKGVESRILRITNAIKQSLEEKHSRRREGGLSASASQL